MSDIGQAETMPVLLVEDDVVDTEHVRRSFRKYGMGNPLHTVRDGVEALELLSGNGRSRLAQPCLLLLDINMPRMNGFQLLREMRDDPVMRRNVVFVLTTSARKEDVLAAYDLDVAGYVLKEHTEQLVELIKSYLQINQLPGA